MAENEPSAKQLTVSDLIDILKGYDYGLPVWITTSDDPERCYKHMIQSDIEKGAIWHPEEEDEDGGPAETDGIIIGSKRFFP